MSSFQSFLAEQVDLADIVSNRTWNHDPSGDPFFSARGHMRDDEDGLFAYE